VLQTRIIASTRLVIKFQVRLQPCVPNSVLCEFDYLDPGDGATIEILHTDEKSYPSILGTIRGMPRGLRDWGQFLFLEDSPGLSLMVAKFSGIFLVLLGVACILSAFLYSPDWDTYLWQSRLINPLRGIIFFCGIILVTSVIWSFWRVRRRFPRELHIDASR
jgi:hypothetical protein